MTVNDFGTLKPNFGLRASTSLFQNQRYYFPLTRGLDVWARVLCILDDVEDFHRILSSEQVEMLIDDNLTITFEHSLLPIFRGPVMSRIVKRMWDAPAVRAVLDDFQIECWDFKARRELS